MAEYFYNGIKPNYTFGTKNIKLDPDNNQITISDTSINKVININSEKFSNNSGQELLFVDLYTTVNKTTALTYPSTNSTTINVNNTISLSNGVTTNTLNQSDWTGTVKTILSTQNLTHYLNMSDASGTGQGNPQKSSLITANPSTGIITASGFSGNSTSSTTAIGVNLTSDNTSGTYYLPFSKTTTATGNALFVDNTTGPLSYNPSTSTLTCSLINSQITQPTTQNTATFTGTTLSINGSSVSFKNSNITFTGNSNTVNALTLTSMIVGGEYKLGIFNNGSGNVTFNTGLGTNIRTLYNSNINISSNSYGFLVVNVLTINSLTVYCVQVAQLT
jgi:hypothetical protein